MHMRAPLLVVHLAALGLVLGGCQKVMLVSLDRDAGREPGGGEAGLSGETDAGEDGAPATDAASSAADAASLATDAASSAADAAASAADAAASTADAAASAALAFDPPLVLVSPLVSSEDLSLLVSAEDASCQGAVLRASDYDESCTADSDCAAIVVGNSCSLGRCAVCFPNAAINRGALERYQADIAADVDAGTLVWKACPCPLSTRRPCCLGTRCAMGSACP